MCCPVPHQPLLRAERAMASRGVPVLLGAALLLRLACCLEDLVLAPADSYDGFDGFYQQPFFTHRVRHHKEHVKELSCGKFYYRTFYLDERRDVLYVGAM
ncbi:Semaphorin-2A [Amphibalanus amphitrite]|uniref:Semaphorin-2A n=1 Tax=Amphibalanus amphitrite TaxID=1232801 RepID=A0A6A4VXB6_AMPAM|nr:Semaphorin-2A [Amphibalanus amphitrite]